MRGISIIGAVFTLLILGIFGAAIVSLVSTDQEMRSRHIGKEQAFYEVQAGFEYAIREINNGGYPVVTNKVLGRGNFTTTIDYPNHFIYSAGSSGAATKTHQITYSTMGGDCLETNNDLATITGPGRTELRGITLKKNCLNAITIDKIQISWTPDNGERVTRIEISNTPVYDRPAGAPSGEIIDITDYIFSGSGAVQMNLVQFTSDISGKNLTMTFYMSDTSYKVMNLTVLPPGR